MERLFVKIRRFCGIIVNMRINNEIRTIRETTTITVTINIKNSNEMIRKISVAIKRFIKRYVVLSLYYETFLSH